MVKTKHHIVNTVIIPDNNTSFIKQEENVDYHHNVSFPFRNFIYYPENVLSKLQFN